MCTNPKRIIKAGKYKETNYRGIKGEEYYIDIFSKCGYCAQCQNEKANNWVIRNYYEAQAHKKICFITLTYKDNTFFLIRKHIQDYLKRLRKQIAKEDIKIRTFYCGEYGTKYKRPHFHILLYGWEEKQEKLHYMGVNQKNNIIWQSETIQNTWGYGRTTYQNFDSHEIPYITLYESAKESESFQYMLSKKKADELIKKCKDRKFANEHRRIIIKECEKALKEMEKNKADYYAFKEFNGWSIALGFEEFFKKYNKYTTYDFNEYIEDKEFKTPSPWVKKLANWGDINAIREMLVRADELTSKFENLESLKKYNIIQQIEKEKQKKLEHITKDYIL